MAKYTVHVELTYEDIEADYPGKACELAEAWALRGPSPEPDAIRSCVATTD